MFFKIEKGLLGLNGGLYTGLVVAEGVDNKQNEQMKNLLNALVQKNKLSTEEIKNHPNFMLYREAMREAGIAEKYMSSIESIMARISKTGTFPSISPIVDLGNFVSIKFGLPVGVYSMSACQNGLEIRRATEDDVNCQDNCVDGESVDVGEPVCISGNVVHTRKLFWRQMPAGRITPQDKDFVIVINGFEKNKDIVDRACTELVDLLKNIFNKDANCFVADSNNPELVVGRLSQEEQQIEEEIAIMLKGVASHTSVSDIREKLRAAKKEKRPLRIKLGLDPSAPDIHIGHAVVLRKIRQLQNLGHKAIIIIGDYTGMIGDPTGKSKTRKQLSAQQVKENADTYMQQIFKIIDETKTEVYYNSQWLGKMTFGDVIALASKCTVARMLERDDFNNRYTNHLPLSVHEFFYPLMQAYDSVAIKADIELGGTDQTFNILMGRDIQRDYGQMPQLTLFMPLLEGTDGIEKMSKSLGNYVGISEPPFVIFEKIMKIPDSMIVKYFNLCTDLHPSEIAKISSRLAENENPRDVKMELAFEIVKTYYSHIDAQAAQQHFITMYQQNGVPDDVPTIEFANDKLCFDDFVNALLEQKEFNSKSELRRLFQQGGVKVNNEPFTDFANLALKDEDVVRIGKRKIYKIKKAK